MKNIYVVLMICGLLGSVFVVKAGSADFVGNWKGNEQCQSVSAPIAVVVITADGPDQVFITGLYSLQGQLRGVISGNTITIPRQAVVDPNFKNIMLEGSITLNKKQEVLTGVFVILNNDVRDNCTVSYHK